LAIAAIDAAVAAIAAEMSGASPAKAIAVEPRQYQQAGEYRARLKQACGSMPVLLRQLRPAGQTRACGSIARCGGRWSSLCSFGPTFRWTRLQNVAKQRIRQARQHLPDGLALHLAKSGRLLMQGWFRREFCGADHRRGAHSTEQRSGFSEQDCCGEASKPTCLTAKPPLDRGRCSRRAEIRNASVVQAARWSYRPLCSCAVFAHRGLPNQLTSALVRAERCTACSSPNRKG
jgi:hypothetical protein